MKFAKVLIVEDEKKVAHFIKQGLEECNFEVDVAYDGKIGKDLVTSRRYDVMILDLNLPALNGKSLCAEIRAQGIKIPVLMLTALGTIDDKLDGFNCGADDYLVKPFEFLELLARIKVLIKRSGQKMNLESILTIHDLEVNIETKSVRRAGTEVELTAKEFSLLVLLMRNPEKVFSRTEIAERIWDINFDSGTNVIDVYINFLRKKVDRNFSKKLIHTHIGQGYSLKVPVT